MNELGELFGTLIIIFYSLALLTFCFKFLNRNFRDILKKNEDFHKIYMLFLKFFVKYHRYFGGVTIFLILAHFFLQFTRYGISITGSIAAIAMLLQIILGAYGQYRKQKSNAWLLLHRGIAIVLLVTILIHVT